MPKYQAKTNNRTYPVSAEELAALDLQATKHGSYHLLKNGKAFQIEVQDVDRIEKRIRLTVNGQEMVFDLLDEIDQQVDALGFSSAEMLVSKDVFAPMPGLVLDILVEEGSEVSAGTPLIILEAMKMENVLKAEGDGTVTAIFVKKGQAVEKKQLLITVE